MTSNLIATINKYLKSAQKWSWNRGVTIPWSDVITDHTPLSLSTHLFVVIHVVIQLSIRHFSHDQALIQWKHQSTVQVQRRRERHRQEAIDTIYEYRDQDRPFETHNSLTTTPKQRTYVTSGKRMPRWSRASRIYLGTRPWQNALWKGLCKSRNVSSCRSFFIEHVKSYIFVFLKNVSFHDSHNKPLG